MPPSESGIHFDDFGNPAVLCRAELKASKHALTQADWVLDILNGMPTIKRIGGFRVVIYPNDHRPAHVHVIGNGYEAIFRLNCPFGPVELR